MSEIDLPATLVVGDVAELNARVVHDDGSAAPPPPLKWEVLTPKHGRILEGRLVALRPSTLKVRVAGGDLAAVRAAEILPGPPPEPPGCCLEAVPEGSLLRTHPADGGVTVSPPAHFPWFLTSPPGGLHPDPSQAPLTLRGWTSPPATWRVAPRVNPAQFYPVPPRRADDGLPGTRRLITTRPIMPRVTNQRGGLSQEEASELNALANRRLDKIRSSLIEGICQLLVKPASCQYAGMVNELVVGYPDLVTAARAERPAEFLSFGHLGGRGFPSWPVFQQIAANFHKYRGLLAEEERESFERFFAMFREEYETPGFRERLQGKPNKK